MQSLTGRAILGRVQAFWQQHGTAAPPVAQIEARPPGALRRSIAARVVRGALLLASATLLSHCGVDERIVLGEIPLPDAGNDSLFGDAGQPTGTADAGQSDAIACDPLPIPIHRYGFDGTGTQAYDSVGGAHGTILGGAELKDLEELTLDGIDDYVDLPNGLISNLEEATLSVWVATVTSAAFLRILDFGVGSDGEDPAEGMGTVGTQFIALTPASSFFPPKLAAMVTNSELGHEFIAPTDVVLDGSMRHIVLTIRSGNDMALFVDGTLRSRVPIAAHLSEIQDVNNWLGRSQFDADPYFAGTYDDVRIYDTALPECALQALFEQGPDAFSL